MAYVDQNELKTHWDHYSSLILERWNTLEPDDVDDFNGNVGRLVSEIRNHTGAGYESIENELARMIDETRSGEHVYQDSSVDSEGGAAVAIRQQYHQATRRVAYGRAEFEQAVRRRPTESVLAAFGVGVFIGAAATLAVRGG